jgi:hypothetical protein
MLKLSAPATHRNGRDDDPGRDGASRRDDATSPTATPGMATVSASLAPAAMEPGSSTKVNACCFPSGDRWE